MPLFHHTTLVLNYHDAVLYGSDVALLESSTAWLNDACVHFDLTFLQQRYAQVQFFDPSVITFLMHQCDQEDLVEFSQGIDKSRSPLVIPINDAHASSAWKTPGGGAHWSLLVLQGEHGSHFDSVEGNNRRVAQAVARKFQDVLGRKISVDEIKTPQQKNGYDCGLHMLVAAEAVAQEGTVSEAQRALSRLITDDPSFARGKRRRMLDIVQSLVSQ